MIGENAYQNHAIGKLFTPFLTGLVGIYLLYLAFAQVSKSMSRVDMTEVGTVIATVLLTPVFTIIFVFIACSLYAWLGFRSRKKIVDEIRQQLPEGNLVDSVHAIHGRCNHCEEDHVHMDDRVVRLVEKAILEEAANRGTLEDVQLTLNQYQS